MDEDTLDKIGQLAERLDHSLFAYKNMREIPAHIHLEGLSGTMKSVRDELCKIYRQNGGTEELDIQAK